MHVILVDDEPLALRELKRAAGAALPSADLACFSSAHEALNHARAHPVDVAFLDVEMQSMDGLTLAKALKDVRRETNIVFITGHSAYAVEAFAVRASDYLLKPVTKKAILDAMDHLRDPIERAPKPDIFIQTFGYFDVFVGGRPIAFSTARAKEVLAYLVDQRGGSVKTADIAGILWEDKPYNRYLLNQTQKAISGLMKTLRENGIERIVLKRWNSMAVDRTQFSCDYYSLLNWDPVAVNAYFGEYMKNYSWAEMTTGALSRRTSLM